MRNVFTFVLVFMSYAANAQLDSILSIIDPNERLASFQHYMSDNYEPLQRYKIVLSEAVEKVPATKDAKLSRELWFYEQEYKTRVFGGDDPVKARAPLIKALPEAEKKSWTYIQARICADLGSFYCAYKMYEQGFEYLVKAIDLVNQLDIKKHPEIIKIYDIAANSYFSFGDHHTAVNLYKKGLEVDSYWRNKSEVFSIINTIGLCYQKMMQYDSAVFYFQLANQKASEVGNEFWAALTDGNRAYTYYLAGDYNKALPLFLNDFELSVAWDQTGSAVNAAMAIATIYLKQNNVNAASKYIEFGRLNQKQLDIRQKAFYYNSLNQISRLQGDYKQAVFYLDSMQIFKDSAAVIHDASIIKNAEVKLNIEKHRHEKQILESEKSRQILLRNSILIILILVGIIIGLWFYNQQLQKERALQLAQKEKTKALEELERASIELQNFTSIIREKNELIQSVKQELFELEQLNHGEERIQYINELLSSNILTEEDWREFKMLFDKVYPGFFVRLKEKLPQLTPAEIRFMALLKLNMSQRDMGYMLGIAYDSIRKTKQRLKSKINQNEEISLEEIFESI
jgi:tetratricopeptide (TPR) repeat protein